MLEAVSKVVRSVNDRSWSSEAEDLDRTGVMRRSNLQANYENGGGREVVEAEKMTTTNKRGLIVVDHAIKVSRSEH